MTPHNSSNVHSSHHDGKNAMRIRFHSSPQVFESTDVTPAEYSAFLSAPSQGKHWHSHLKFPNHTWNKVND